MIIVHYYYKKTLLTSKLRHIVACGIGYTWVTAGDLHMRLGCALAIDVSGRHGQSIFIFCKRVSVCVMGEQEKVVVQGRY